MDLNTIIKESYLKTKPTLSSQDEKPYLFINELFKIELQNKTNNYLEILIGLIPLYHSSNRQETFIHYLELVGITSNHPYFNDLLEEFKKQNVVEPIYW